MTFFLRLFPILARCVVTVAAVGFALSNVELEAVYPILAAMPAVPLAGALLLFHATQVMGSERTRYYLRAQDIHIPAGLSLRLQYVGELFSTVLPGGAASDAYKTWWLKRYTGRQLGSMARIIIGARLNGLWALGALSCVLALVSNLATLVPHANAYAGMALVAGTAGYMLVAWRILREPLRRQLGASAYSLPLQLALIVVVWLLCIGLGMTEHAIEYAVLYMLSCLLALLPVSLGGIGLREIVMLQGSMVLGFDTSKGVALGLCLTALTLSVSAVGAVLQITGRARRGE